MDVVELKLCELIAERGNPQCGQVCCEKCYIENLTIWLDYFKGELNGSKDKTIA